MKILLLKQNPDPFVKRLSPGATCFLSSSVSLSLSQIRNTPQGDVPPGDKSLFLIPHVGIVASFQGKARDLMRLRSALNHLLSPPPSSLFFFPLQPPGLIAKAATGEAQLTASLFRRSDNLPLPLPLLNLFSFDGHRWLRRERERESYSCSIRWKVWNEAGGSDRGGQFEHSIFQTGPWINMNPFKTNTRD